jgi:nickel superoxide dismutase
MKKTTKKTLIAGTTCTLIVVLASIAYSHCQIPCGIYGDHMRFDMIAENLATVERSMNQITQLSKEEKPDMNQIVRWVNNKEKHAEDISQIITYYFMAQRIKPADKTDPHKYEQYIEKLTTLHEMLVYTMKAKQSTDIENVQKIRAMLAEFKTAYFEKAEHEH